jgi:hypothetical protein
MACGEYATNKLSAFDWHRQFKEAGEAVLDDSRSGHQTHKVQVRMWAEYEPWCAQIED